MIAERGCLFDAHAGVGAHVNGELTRVDRREEVLPQRWDERERGQGEGQKHDEENARVIDREGEQAQVPVAEALEAGFKGGLEAREWISAGALSQVCRVVVLLQ